MTVLEQRDGKSKEATVTLIPWDPDSSIHVERLYHQRIACGWDQELIESWKDLQRTGKVNIQWVILSDDDPDKQDKLARHIERFPEQKQPLQDSATSFGGKARDPPSVPLSFMPVGHISLTIADPDPEIDEPEGSVFVIANFYISHALQNQGVGRAAFDIVERMAIAEPLRARVLTINTIVGREAAVPDRRRALGIPLPKFLNEDWYARRGYTAYKEVPNSYPEYDRTGKLWTSTAVYMKKKIW